MPSQHAGHSRSAEGLRSGTSGLRVAASEPWIKAPEPADGSRPDRRDPRRPDRRRRLRPSRPERPDHLKCLARSDPITFCSSREATRPTHFSSVRPAATRALPNVSSNHSEVASSRPRPRSALRSLAGSSRFLVACGPSPPHIRRLTGSVRARLRRARDGRHTPDRPSGACIGRTLRRSRHRTSGVVTLNSKWRSRCRIWSPRCTERRTR